MSMPAYRDGALHLRDELEDEQARLLAEDDVRGGGSRALSAELDEIRLRIRAPVKSSVDATARRLDLERYDAALEAARIARSHQRGRWRVRLVLGGLGAALVVGGALSFRQAALSERRADSCALRDACWEEGRCVPSFGTLVGLTRATDLEGCVARRDYHCARACAANGRCRRSGDVCVAESDLDCANSASCRTDGECRLSGHRCAPDSDEHCQKSNACFARGACELTTRPEGQRCGVAGDDAT